MLRLLLNKRLNIILLCLMGLMVEVLAEVAYPHHYISVTLGGGEANTLTRQDSVTDKIGGAGQFQIAYELQYKKFFFNIGVGADYTYTSQSIDDFAASFSHIDIEEDSCRYSYLYSDYRETQQTFSVIVPLQIGCQFGELMYGAVGAKLCVPLFATYATTTSLLTQIDYGNYFDPIRNTPLYGCYAPDTYTSSGICKAKAQMQAAVTGEIGWNIPLEARKTRMRAGLYAEYALPIGEMPREDLVYYDDIDTNPKTMNQADLKQHIHFNSWLDSNSQKQWHHNLQVGVRLTILFDVTGDPYDCMCEE